MSHCAALGALVLAGPAAAQEVRRLSEPPQFALDQWTTEHGLPQNSVNALAQTPDGYLWVGTFGGLARFDGSSFRLIERLDSSGRHIDRVLSLAAAHDGSLWVGTESGLLHLRPGPHWDVYAAADGLPDDEITALHVDRAGTLWIGTERGGLVRFGGERFEVFRRAGDVSLEHVISIHEGSDGRLWVNAGDRFVTVEQGVPAATSWQRRAVRDAIHMATEDRDRALWFNGPNGLARVKDGVVRRYGRGAGVPGRARMMEDPGGGFWLGTTNDGLYFFEPDGAEPVRPYPLPGGQQRYRVRSTLVDREGSAWFGTNANGLVRVRRNLFTTYTSATGLSHDVATAVYVDAAGTVWAGTNCGGVNAIDLTARVVRTWKPRRPGDPRGDPCVFALTEADSGVMLAGTWGGGLTRISGGREERLRLPGLDTVVLALFTDRDGVVWVGTNSGGLAALDGGRVRATYTTEQGLAHNSVRTIYQARDGALWVGTLGGLSRLQNGRITSYSAADGLSAPHVRAIYEDPEGDLWIGTYGGGINRFHGGVFRAVLQRDGLRDDVVSAIAADERGQLWLSGNRGISRVSREQLVAFTEGRLQRVHAVLYREADGLANAETNGGFQPAVARDPRGHLWFPTVRGFVVVDPARVAGGGVPPPVALEEIVVDGLARPFGAPGIVVGPGRPNVEFRYTGLSLSAPQHVTFRYRLERFDETWVEVGSRRVAYYPRLPPGEYRFAVSAANRDGVWNDAAFTLAVRVRGPFWGTWWFRLAAAVVTVALVIALVKRRRRLARERQAAEREFARRLIESQERERKRVAGELHDGLGQELLVIKNRTLLALRAADGVAPMVREQLGYISDVVGQSLDAVRGLAHNLTPYQLDHLGLSAALRTMIETAARSADMRFEIAVEDVDGVLPIEDQINLFRIVQEAVTNIVRHSGAATAAVRVWRSPIALAVLIHDDGRGFTPTRDGSGRLAGGFGLSGIAERARILRGRLDVTSAPGQGTRLDLVVPVAAATPVAR
jgi:signal transduction histidine kinase/ligand-binding sensor domain-containing protein